MNDMIDAEMHQKHENRLTQAETQIQGLTNTTVRIEANVEKVDGKCEAILNAVNSNNKSSSKSGTSTVKTFAALGLTVIVGFMTVVNVPMRESIDERRLEQDEKNKLQAANLKLAEVSIFDQAVDSSYTNGKQDGIIECIQTQLNAVDDKGPRGSTK